MTTAPPPGGTRATIYEVAEAAGVSIATVSRMLSSPDKVSPRTREKVQQAIDVLNYVPHGAARSLAARQQEAYGLVLPELTGPYYPELLTGFESAAAERGASVVLLLTRDKPGVELALRRLAGRVDAVALMGGVHVPASVVADVARKVPVVGVAVAHLGSGVESFSTDNVDSARELTTHLISTHGLRRLVFVGATDTVPDAQGRYEGFVQAHRDAGLKAPPPVSAELSEEGGLRVADMVTTGVLSADGLVCANDELALALVRELPRAGIEVPGRLAVTGWDDQMAARYVTPALTTVRQPVRDLGQAAASRIHELLADPGSAPPDHRLATSVVIRRSCGCDAA
ncbi:LacI family DNA-binding transcriptional regulator [Ornithinimicrobium tianjinense]|uniref:LacI family transcriptional regulator n=1 Tax=Ornithinimicrobium tianjinense TaxID=1195761 RepID=A0A917BFS8_9MICO|nr:LacI family DNA-binding transcriptional regulator [Ornithinimicrobium tianjinense]GGF40219.1 LacI family transcriptional regulator [Ornithinimicrobium tianjinense]